MILINSWKLTKNKENRQGATQVHIQLKCMSKKPGSMPMSTSLYAGPWLNMHINTKKSGWQWPIKAIMEAIYIPWFAAALIAYSL